MKKYTIEFLRDGIYSDVETAEVIAANKTSAYLAFISDNVVWAAWVARVTYANGKTHECNTFAGKPV